MKKSFHLIVLCVLAGLVFTASAQKMVQVDPNLDKNVHTYIAPLLQGDDLISVYPQNVNYWTGSCDASTKTQVSLINGVAQEVGWAVFDVSGIPLGATINSITFYGYLYDNAWPYWSITPMASVNPVTDPAATINAQVANNYTQGVAYSFNQEGGALPLGWLSRGLTDNNATGDLQNALPQGWFAIGIVDWDFSTSFYVRFQGWQEANIPYLQVDYTLPLTHDVGTQSVDIPGTLSPGTVTPKATVFSQSTQNETFNVTLTITGGYSSTKTVTNLAPGGTQQVTFDDWNATLGDYTAEACTQLGSDPNPANNCLSKPIHVANVLEEVFGGQQFTFGPSGLRGRGNIFLCSTPRTVVEHRLYLNPAAGTNLWFVIYEGSAFNGTYTLVNSVNMPNSGTGQGWYSSGTISFNLQAGMYYMIYTLFDLNANYYNNQSITPYPIPCSFGTLESGVGWNWSPVYNNPPNPTETPTEVPLSGVAYYQTIVTTPIIPVELLSFTFQQDKNNVTLNWVTATETNNAGYDLERKTDGEYTTIAHLTGFGSTTERHTYTYTDQNLQSGTYTYRLKQIDYDGTAYYYDPLVVEVLAPVEFSLEQNYPNPFNPSTTINFGLAVDSKVSLKIYNTLGQEVATLVNGNMDAGSHEVNFNAASINSGVYFYKIDASGVDGSNFSSVKKMILTK